MPTSPTRLGRHPQWFLPMTNLPSGTSPGQTQGPGLRGQFKQGYSIYCTTGLLRHNGQIIKYSTPGPSAPQIHQNLMPG